MIFEMISVGLSATTVIVAAATFIVDFKRKKKTETLEKINEIFDEYYKIKNKDINMFYSDYVTYLSNLERFARSVNEGVYYKKIVKSNLSIMLTEQYKKSLKEIIEQRRKQFERDSYYENIEIMISYFSQ